MLQKQKKIKQKVILKHEVYEVHEVHEVPHEVHEVPHEVHEVPHEVSAPRVGASPVLSHAPAMRFLFFI